MRRHSWKFVTGSYTCAGYLRYLSPHALPRPKPCLLSSISPYIVNQENVTSAILYSTLSSPSPTSLLFYLHSCFTFIRKQVFAIPHHGSLFSLTPQVCLTFFLLFLFISPLANKRHAQNKLRCVGWITRTSGSVSGIIDISCSNLRSETMGPGDQSINKLANPGRGSTPRDVCTPSSSSEGRLKAEVRRSWWLGMVRLRKGIYGMVDPRLFYISVRICLLLGVPLFIRYVQYGFWLWTSFVLSYRRGLFTRRLPSVYLIMLYMDADY